MALIERYLNPDRAAHKIALVNLVEYQERSGEYQYRATRIYDIDADTVTDIALTSRGQLADMSDAEYRYAAWNELPMLDIRTKQLVGKNKDKYCTIISARVFRLASKHGDDAACRIWIPPLHTDVVSGIYEETVPVHILGYTFMDINGDKCYLTMPQIRSSGIIQRTHSAGTTVDLNGMYTRMIMLGASAVRRHTPTLEVDDVDTSLEDIEVAQTKLCKALMSGWYTMSADGSIEIDRAEVGRQRLEELEVPDGIRHIPPNAFACLGAVKRIKLPESVFTIGVSAFLCLSSLEEINIPSQIKDLHSGFEGCKNLKRLDLSGVERLIDFILERAERLIVPDILRQNRSWACGIDVLEFRNTANAARRELKVVAAQVGKTLFKWRVGRIETNGAVVLGNYGVAINCTDASALEPNIVGIAPDCSFRKVDAEGNPQPWLLGATTEFVYTAECAYQFTATAHTANKLRVAVVDKHISTVLPKSVEILQGKLSVAMCSVGYPNVTYATYGLYSEFVGESNTVVKMPSLRWLLPSGEILTEAQIKQLEQKLTPILPEICKHTQEVFKLDLTRVVNLERLKGKLLYARSTSTEAAMLFKEYGLVYVGNYGAALGKETQR